MPEDRYNSTECRSPFLRGEFRFTSSEVIPGSLGRSLRIVSLAFRRPALGWNSRRGKPFLRSQLGPENILLPTIATTLGDAITTSRKNLKFVLRFLSHGHPAKGSPTYSSPSLSWMCQHYAFNLRRRQQVISFQSSQFPNGKLVFVIF